MTQVNLARTNLREADMEDANLAEAEFNGTIMPDGTIRNLK
jgi:uncharacterized protein YjbI with pentapeptide repeats